MVLALVLGCGAGNVALSWDTPPCENWDFDNPEDPSLDVSTDGDRIVIQRIGVYQAEDAVFDPEIIADGSVIAIYEDFNSQSEGELDYCYSPVVYADPERAAKFTIEWFEDGANQVTHTREIDTRE